MSQVKGVLRGVSSVEGVSQGVSSIGVLMVVSSMRGSTGCIENTGLYRVNL